MATPPMQTLKWSAQLSLAPPTHRLVGDKITLPQSALEALLAAAPVVEVEQHGSHQQRNLTSTFDPFNPFSFAAESRAREAFADRQQQLPHPLTFRLVNPANGRAVYAGIREFSAEEGRIELSSFLRQALGFETVGSSELPTREASPAGQDVTMTNGSEEKTESAVTVTVHAHQLPKGTYVRLRPLEAGYDPKDWKSLLERYLRDTHTTLTINEILDIKGARHEHFRFLVDKFEPESEGICIVDTDLEVDIEALNEEQARETLEKRLAKARRAPGTKDGSSAGGSIELGAGVEGQVVPGEYVDYQLLKWDHGRDLEVTIESDKDGPISVDVLINPMSGRQRAKPRLDEYVSADLSNSAKKTVKLSARNVEMESSESLCISIHAWKDSKIEYDQPVPYSIRATYSETSNHTATTSTDLSPDETTCKNCHQRIPKRTLPLHEAFCYRNNILCPTCSNVYLKSSPQWKAHWHCPHDGAFSDTPAGITKHNALFHPPSPLVCPACDFTAYDTPILAHHRTTSCPQKTILCQFCHLEVPQQSPDDPSFTDPEVLLSGLTPHELADGARTTDCHICSRIVRLRDMRTHLALHDRERISKPTPRVCVNEMCSRTVPLGEETRVAKEQLGLCNVCFGPMYNSAYDPEGKALRRRVERRLLQQLMGGCGKGWCVNQMWCRTGHKNVSGQDRIYATKDALPVIKPVMEALIASSSSGLSKNSTQTDGGATPPTALSFCVDDTTQQRTAVVNLLKQDLQQEYAAGWIAKAVEETKGNVFAAQDWLKDRAPRVGEVVR